MMLAATFELWGALLTGALLLWGGGLFDLVDGVVARHFERSSAFGAFLDSTLDRLVDMVQPFAESVFAMHRDEGRPIVLATTTPYDLVKPFADRLGLDGVVATRYGVEADDDTYNGDLSVANLRHAEQNFAETAVRRHTLYLYGHGDGGVTIRDLFVDSLRMRPDRIIVGRWPITESLVHS